MIGILVHTLRYRPTVAWLCLVHSWTVSMHFGCALSMIRNLVCCPALRVADCHSGRPTGDPSPFSQTASCCEWMWRAGRHSISAMFGRVPMGDRGRLTAEFWWESSARRCTQYLPLVACYPH